MWQEMQGNESQRLEEHSEGCTRDTGWVWGMVGSVHLCHVQDDLAGDVRLPCTQASAACRGSMMWLWKPCSREGWEIAGLQRGPGQRAGSACSSKGEQGAVAELMQALRT